jgi:hypothetical protein
MSLSRERTENSDILSLYASNFIRRSSVLSKVMEAKGFLFIFVWRAKKFGEKSWIGFQEEKKT